MSSWYSNLNFDFKNAPTRKLGKTGWDIPLFSLGGESIIKSANKKDHPFARNIISTFLESGGKYIDTSPIYSEKEGDRASEKRISEVIESFPRDSFYLATKTEYRDKEKAWKDINESIETLGTTPDCVQIHHLDKEKEVNQIFKNNGAMKALLRAKDEGLIKYIGITGHSDPKVLMSALKKYDFDTVLGALNPGDAHLKEPFQKELIPYCSYKNIGFIAMKVCSRGALFAHGGIKSMKQTLDYVWSFPVSTAIIGINNINQLKRNIELANRFNKLSDEDIIKIQNNIIKESIENIMYFNQEGNEEMWDYYGSWDQTPHFVL